MIDKETVIPLLNLYKTCYEKYNYLMSFSFSFIFDMFEIQINTGTGYKFSRVYDINELEQELPHLFEDFEKEIVEYQLHVNIKEE